MDWLANKTLNQLRLNEEGVLVLGINKANGKFIGAPRGETKILKDDTVTLYGRADLLWINVRKGLVISSMRML